MTDGERLERELETLGSPGFADRVRPFVAQGVLSRHVVFLTDVLGTAVGENDPDALLWAAMVLSAQRRGHTALPTWDLARYLPPREQEDATSDSVEPLHWPTGTSAVEGSRLLATSPPLLELHPTPGGLVLQAPRMGSEEQWVADALVALAAPVPQDEDRFLRPSADCLARGLARFGDSAGQAEHPGCVALRALAERRLAVITGGPGTGKTWSIKRVLAMLLDAAHEQHRELVIRLAAPTGKAGVRMKQALAEDLDELNDLPVPVREQLGRLGSSTLHRLLRIRPGAGTSRFGPGLPLPADVVVVDEASMVDLTLMRQLVRAIGPTTRLVLLGDRDQLPSVDVGSVLADLVAQPFRALRGEAQDGGPLAPVLCRFTKNHRSGQAPTLARLVEALQDEAEPARRASLPYLTGKAEAPDESLSGRVRQVAPKGHGGGLSSDQLDMLVAPWEQDRLALRPAPGEGKVVRDWPGYLSRLADLLSRGESPLAEVANATPELLAGFDRYRVLAVHRSGPLGVSGLTRSVESRIEKRLKEAWTRPSPGRPWPRRAGKWLGQAVLVTENSYELDLWNGDIGLVLPDPDKHHELAVAFPADPEKHPCGHRLVPIDRLPAHTSGFVLTVHKSQGSQYDHVAVVLSSRASAIQTRELVYTGITRASQRVTWVGTEEHMAAALATPVVRGSRLGWRLTGEEPPLPS